MGADLLLYFNHLLADKLEALYFLPTSVKISVAPVLYKVLKFSMLSKVYNQNSPLSIIGTAFEKDGNVQGTLVNKAFNGVAVNFELIPDPMCAPGTSFNTTSEDLMFIVFDSFQSELDGEITDLVMAPVPIDKMILPTAPGFRDGTVRTSLKRIGSLIAPIAGAVHVVSGMGQNSRYAGT